MWASIWLRTHLREMGWAVHCLENDPSHDQSALAFERLWKASNIIHDNLEVKCTPPAVLMSMTALLRFGSPDNRPSSMYSYTSRKFFLAMAAEILPVSYPTLLLLKLLLCEQSSEALPAISRAGGNVIGQCIGMHSEDIWTSQIELSHAVTISNTDTEPETCLGSSDAEISTMTGGGCGGHRWAHIRSSAPLAINSSCAKQRRSAESLRGLPLALHSAKVAQRLRGRGDIATECATARSFHGIGRAGSIWGAQL